MRFHSDGPSIPDVLLQRCDAGRVVFLCGAGVSLPSEMPTFVGLTKYVINQFAPPVDSDIMKAFQPWLDDEAIAKACRADNASNTSLENKASANVPLDQIFNLLHIEYGRDEVNALVAQRLREVPAHGESGREHGLIRRISSSGSGLPKIVTTNFDLLFESGMGNGHLEKHIAPAFPDLNFGSDIGGITYLHGRLDDTVSAKHSYVLSSADFGRAYLAEGWATNFIRHLLERYTVVLVGYQAEDPPVKYLLQGLNHDGEFDRSKLYAFDRGRPEEIEAKWRDRGVFAIPYAEHTDLWKTMESWADRADDPRKWRAGIISISQQDPKCLIPHQRGQVAHVLRSVAGAKLFAAAEPIPHPEWICVLDANVRAAKPSSGYGDHAELFDPQAAYGLDDDTVDISDADSALKISQDSLLVWRDGDDSPQEAYRLGGTADSVPKRLMHLIAWMEKSIDSPVLAWWTIRHLGLHPRLLERLERQVRQSQLLDQRGRHTWQLIFESLRDPRNRRWNGEWFDWEKRVSSEGWSAGVLREFRRVAAPQLSIKPPYGLANSKPPSQPWESVPLRDLGEFEIVFFDRHGQMTDVPDAQLPQVIEVLEDQFRMASGLLADIGTTYFTTPTCYPDLDADDEDHISHATQIMKWFIELFDRLAEKWPQLAAAHVMAWPATDPFFFRKLKLYGLSKSAIFPAHKVAQTLLSLEQQVFWDSHVARELLYLVADRWSDFSASSQKKLMARVLAGRDQHATDNNAQFPYQKDELAARYARYLELQGCKLTAEHSGRIARIVSGIPEWNDGWATSLVTVHGTHARSYGSDESPDVLLNLPVNQILAKAREEEQHNFETMTEKSPFSGLVKADPRKALAALTLGSKNNDHPQAYWASLINDFPPDATPALRREFLKQLSKLPHDLIVSLRQTLGHWLVRNLAAILVKNEKLGLAIYDRIVDALFMAGADATKSFLNEVQKRGAVAHQSRRTYDHAMNGPVGDCAAALFSTLPGPSDQAASLIPQHIRLRIMRLFAAPGEGADHVVSMACRDLNRFMLIDPAWTTEHLVPTLALDHPSAEPAWNGFLHAGHRPCAALAAVAKPQLLHLFPWIESFSWSHKLQSVAAAWLVGLRIFDHHEPGGFSRHEIRGALRAMPDEARNHCISSLSQLGRKNPDGWENYVIPLVNNDWPRERQYRTAASMRAWISLLGSTGNSFPVVYAAVRRFLVPVETTDHIFYRFSHDDKPDESLTILFPDVTLDLMHRTTPQVLIHTPYELPKLLGLIAEADPALEADPRYLRLIELIERS